MSKKLVFLSPKFPKLIPIQTLIFQNSSHKFINRKLFSSIDTKIQSHTSQFNQSHPSNPNPNPNFPNSDFDSFSTALKSPNIFDALDGIKTEPSPPLLLAIFKRFESSPKPVFSLFKWAERRPGYVHTPSVFNSMVNILAKSGEFKWELMLLINKVKLNDEFVSAENLGFLIRNFVRLGMYGHAIRLYEFAETMEVDLFDVLLDGLCRYGQVKVACDCIDRKMCVDPDWTPSVEEFNFLLEGWFRLKSIEKVEEILLGMRRENRVLGVDTYGILVSGYCRMGLVDKAVELLGEMRGSCVTPNRRVYDPLVDALAGVGRLKEALDMLERFLVLEAGPTLTTYNSLVRGFCKAGDVDGAGRILKLMSSRGIVPTATTYNHLFRCFMKCGKIDEGMGLYRKLIRSGYEPNETTFQLMLSMLCEEERLDWVAEIREDMRSKKHVLNLEMRNVVIDVLRKTFRFKEAVMELEELIQSGFVPDFGSCETLRIELKKKGLHEMAMKVSNMIKTVPCSKPPSSAFVESQRRKSIILKAKAMSNSMKACSKSKKNVKCRRFRRSASRRKK